jgi:hypothetical protein
MIFFFEMQYLGRVEWVVLMVVVELVFVKEQEEERQKQQQDWH